uniref:Uncharacterized protein n=1 Tax=Rhizophagus irregularis (strain DAOM 181602 / DAOM 197198 / MUCL 43194) TaxID=747089 RepID=U9V029_RHIID
MEYDRRGNIFHLCVISSTCFAQAFSFSSPNDAHTKTNNNNSNYFNTYQKFNLFNSKRRLV